MRITRTNSHHIDFKSLVTELDSYLAVTDGDDHDFYDQFNKLDHIHNVIVLYIDDVAIGCGAIKEYDSKSMEIKRMYTRAAHRGKGVASQVIEALEDWAAQLGFQRCILETGINQQEAISLYKKCGYRMIENYGPYKGIENSFCFEKNL